MTLLQVLNMSFYLLVYPFLIRVLGTAGYGLYAYATSFAILCITVVNFGFDLPSAKRVAENGANKNQLGRIITEVTIAKIYIEAIMTVVFGVLLYTVPIFAGNKLIFLLAYLQTLTAILFPQWYFHGLQRMGVVTYIQFGFKLLSLPFLFSLLHTEDDVWIFMAISTVASLLGGMAAWLYIRLHDKVSPDWGHQYEIRPIIREAGPFFLSNIAGMVKEQGVVLLAGAMLSMSDVAFYDLANKIILIPRTICSKLNDAIYPQYVTRCEGRKTNRLLQIETLLGLGVILLVALLGKPAVLILGGAAMAASYGISILLSITVLTWMIAGIYIYFGIIPSGQNRWITINQLIAMVVALAIVGIGLNLYSSVYVMALGIAMSGLSEIVFLSYITHKYKMI